MSYQVLARKYRPASFEDLEGQAHVLQALVNALDNERLHHAYLFTGTRGVGKTTIARILARCLNCEKGITSKPCGQCSSCVEITEGRSIDLIEVDAASRTGVDDMRELLDNVQYMPTVSRFKIYLIDEVHMLSKSSFNAMLKTLEEPPEHVKFLFATTDPKKLPITVLSRCLQFNLKNLSPEQIVRYLGTVLPREAIEFDESALWQLAHAADGSMRDALSLTDQAISFGNNEVRDAQVKEMLGSIDQSQVFDLLDAIAREDGAGLLEKISTLAEFSPDYVALLNDILAVLHRVAIAHAVPEAVDNAQGDKELVLSAADQISREHVQLLYQIGLIGQRDLPLAPMPRIGFEMVLLRMMSFAPEGSEGKKPEKIQRGGASAEITATASNQQKSAQEPVSKTVLEPVSKTVPETVPETVPKTVSASPIAGLLSAINGENVQPMTSEKDRIAETNPRQEAPTEALPVAPAFSPENWSSIIDMLALTGVTKTLAANCQLASTGNGRCLLKLGEHHASLWNASHESRIEQALTRLYGNEIKVAIEVGSTDVETPAQKTERRNDESQAQAIIDIEADQHVRELIDNFNGKLDPSSIAPLGRVGD